MTNTTPKLNASSRIMYETAQRLGIRCTTFSDQETILMEWQGKTWYTRGSRTSLQSSVGKTIADQKPLTKAVLQHYHLPTAKGLVFNGETDMAALSALTFPVVVKPTNERHGKGVVVGVNTTHDVLHIWQKHRTPLLIEETLRGTEYRIVCINFQFVAAAFRKPAHVIGDGKHTVQELIDEKNKHPWRGKGHQNNLSLIEVDEFVTDYLAEQKLDLGAIPELNREVLLRHISNLSTGGEAWDVTDIVSPENRALFEQIARACDLNIIGIDIMCGNLKQPIIDQPHAGVIEVNASPGLRMHHYPMQGQVRDVASQILKMTQQTT